MAETDNPWKQALDDLCLPALTFFLPEQACRLNQARGFETLETELRPLLPTTRTGLKRVDKLLKVWRRETVEGDLLEEGAEEEDFYHFEVQYQKEDGFEKRVSDYNDVARVHLRNPVVSLVILGDEDPAWRPSVYRWEKDGCVLIFQFRAFKLLDWRGQEEELARHDNPFALFVLAHLLSRPTERDAEARGREKLRLWQRACEHKMEEQDRNCLLRLIDWMLLLPPELNRPLLLRFQQWREDNPMAFVSVFEQEILEQKQRIAEQKQRIAEQKQQITEQEQQMRDGFLRGIELTLKLKFGEAGKVLFPEVQKQSDLAWLRHFLDSIEQASSCDDLRRLLP